MAKIRKQHGIRELSVLMNNVCYKLKRYREEAGLSQNELARQSKVALSTINELENQIVGDVKLSTLVQIARTLKKPAITLLIDTDMNLSDPDRREFQRAFEELEKAFRTLDRLHTRIK